MDPSIYCFTLKGKLVKKYESTQQAADELKISYGHINANLSGRYKRAWKYVFSRIPRFPGYSVRKNNSRRIKLYQIDGKYVKTFDNVMDASAETGVDYTKIYFCCNRNLPHGDFIFRYAPKAPPLQDTKQQIPKRIYQFNQDKKLLNVFESIAEASRNTGITKQAISACCLGKSRTAGGFLWSRGNIIIHKPE